MESTSPEEDFPPSAGGFTTPARQSNVASSTIDSGKPTATKHSGKLSATKQRRKKYNALIDVGKKVASSDRITREKTISEQEKKEIALTLKKQKDSIEHCSHILKLLSRSHSGPNSWLREEYKPIRESFEVLRSNPQQFSPVVGDQLPDGSIFTVADATEDVKMPALTSTYISSIATFGELDFEIPQVLQVVASKMLLETSSVIKKKNSIHFTHLRLRDGSNDIITARLSMHIAHEGNKLDNGDSIRLNSYTPLTYMPSGLDNPQRSPAIVIHTYGKVGYASIPSKLNKPLHCIDRSISDQLGAVLTDESLGEIYFEDDIGQKGSLWEPLVEVKCSSGHRYCSVFGVSTVLSLCDTDPVENINLEMVREYCYFATTEVSKMSNSWKRNMLY